MKSGTASEARTRLYRLVCQILDQERAVKVLRMWTHYEQAGPIRLAVRLRIQMWALRRSLLLRRIDSMHRSICRATVALALLAAAPLSALSPVNKTLFGGVAIDGYDPVAYFTDGKPVEGRKAFSYEWMGATWRFASAAHRDLFVQEPARYVPQYGGYCAFAVAKAETADIDPDAWTIHDGRLYLNYDLEIQAQWLADMETFITRADVNWPKLLAK